MTDVQDLTTEGYRLARAIALESFDPGDVFGWVQGWRFAICDALLFDFGYSAPGYRNMADSPEESYEYEVLKEVTYGPQLIMDDGESLPISAWHWEDDLKTLLAVLDRYRVWVGLAGQDY